MWKKLRILSIALFKTVPILLLICILANISSNSSQQSKLVTSVNKKSYARVHTDKSTVNSIVSHTVSQKNTNSVLVTNNTLKVLVKNNTIKFLVKNKTTKVQVKNKTTKVQVKNKTTKVQVKNNTLKALVKNNTTKVLVKNKTTKVQVKNNTLNVLVKNNTTKLFVKNKTTNVQVKNITLKALVKNNTTKVLVKNKTTKVQVRNNTTKSTQIYDYSFPYLHVPVQVCKSNGAKSDPFLLIVVKSDVNHIAHRIAIRNTWGASSNPGIKLVFLLGYSPLLKSFIQMESDTYKDIIQQNFLDDYQNNTLKTIMGFTWVASHCSDANYIFFVDDDYIVNTKYIWNHLHSLYIARKRSVFLGYVWKDAKPQRNAKSKWFIPKDDFKDDIWPPYASGGSLVLTIDIINKLLTQFKFMKPIFIDDVYLGIVCKELQISPIHESRFSTQYRPDRMKHLFSSHGFRSPMKLVEDWNKFKIKYDMVL
ncbi:beta-1,3-galactosyltransferase 2-like [Mytilus californianus]|uniref:beta-1,3-galactosyltransferase 2-like n=1 Tax=Mytilus californianus TaxID=6549 RepID=UPI0022478410|nr:beta-1,3-galactosyltransferase 2-like [Mytilus californianus]